MSRAFKIKLGMSRKTYHHYIQRTKKELTEKHGWYLAEKMCDVLIDYYFLNYRSYQEFIVEYEKEKAIKREQRMLKKIITSENKGIKKRL